METADPTLEVQEPDSLEEPGQEPEAAGPEEPSPEDATPDSGELAAAEEAGAEEQPADAGAEPAEDAGEEAPSEPGPSTEPSPSGEPFSFRVDGRSVDVEGATEADGVIQIPRDSWDAHVQNRLADRGVIQQREERMQNRVRQLQEEAEAREERFKTVLGKVDELFSDPERIRQFVERYEAEAPRFKLEIENELLKSQTKRHEQTVQTKQQEAEEREFNELAPAALQNAVDMVVERVAEGADVDSSAIVEELQGLWDAGVPIFFRVKEGDGSGLDPKEHKWGVDLQRVAKLARPHIELHRKTAAQTKAEKAEKRNAEALGKEKKKPKPPPTAPASGSPTPGGEDKYPTTREEYEEWKQKRSEEVGLPL